MRLASPILACVACVVMMLSVTAGGAFATGDLGGGATRYVDDDGWGSADGCSGHAKHLPTSVQAAVDMAGDGDRIMVCPGTYESDPIRIEDLRRLTLRGVTPWTATLNPGPDFPADSDFISVQDARHFKMKWLNVVAPTQQPCTRVAKLLDVRGHSEHATIRANHFGAEGPDTLGPCGYETGIGVFTNYGRVLWNRVTDFWYRAIYISGDEMVIRGNTIRYLHASSAPLAEEGVGVGIHYVGLDIGGTLIAGNLIRSLPTAGDTTPIMSTGVLLISSPADVVDNTFRNVQDAIHLRQAHYAVVANNLAVVNIQRYGLFNVQSHYADVYLNRLHAWEAGILTSGVYGDIHDNNFAGPSATDCQDLTTDGDYTAGTWNTWIDNTGTGSPAGICWP